MKDTTMWVVYGAVGRGYQNVFFTSEDLAKAFAEREWRAGAPTETTRYDDTMRSVPAMFRRPGHGSRSYIVTDYAEGHAVEWRQDRHHKQTQTLWAWNDADQMWRATGKSVTAEPLRNTMPRLPKFLDDLRRQRGWQHRGRDEWGPVPDYAQRARAGL